MNKLTVILFGLLTLLVSATPLFAQANPQIAKASGDGAIVSRTAAEVEALIQSVGRTPPEWLAATPLNYPKTLDLAWPHVSQGWNNQKNVGQYLWDVINPNPSRWREGVKLMHHVLTQNKGNKETVRRTTDALGHLYAECLQDYARGAFWWRFNSEDNDLELAHCYHKLGCKEMVEKILRDYPVDRTRHATIIKLWSDLGELETALKLAEAKAANGAPDSAFLAAGEACRRAGQYSKALAYFEKSAAATDGSRDLKRNVERAKAAAEAVRLFDSFNLATIADGSYTAASLGYEGPVLVRVDVKQKRIAVVNVTQHREKQFYSALTDTPAQIIAKQTLQGVDATSGATITSAAIINATAKALTSAKK